jgi:hypothetical protein
MTVMIVVWESAGLKHGPGIGNAAFSHLYDSKNPREVGLSAAAQAGTPHIYDVTLDTPTGNIRVRANGYYSSVLNSCADGRDYTVWLDKVT